MKFYLISSLLVLTLLSSAYAEIIKNNTHFKDLGKVSSFLWAPARYENDFRYDIFYYIPEKLKDAANVPALIFNHGGGASTMDRPGSVEVVGRYMGDLKRLADDLGIIVVLPSANGLNWGGHTRGLVRELATMMRTELDIDANKLSLSGHSMGGMGITRNYLWVADEVAFFLPMAAGMDEKSQNEQMLNKVFNVPYVHLQGKFDHFDIFITRCEEQEKRTKELEAKYGLKSLLEIIYYDGTHNYDYNLFKNTAKRLFENAPRNLYQKELFGSLHTVHTKILDNNITYDYESEARYFWLELTKIDLSVAERVDFHAKIEGNIINIDMPKIPAQSRGLRLYLDSRMLDLTQTVEVFLNGNKIAEREPKSFALRNFDERDPGFLFEDAMDIDLP